jgi:glucosamine 6-phosphate synthetase-like amidotransferase/phosphosugar isomerase protein
MTAGRGIKRLNQNATSVSSRLPPGRRLRSENTPFEGRGTFFVCGIAGYSLSSDSSASRTLAAQALLAGISERGADAVGYAVRGGDGAVDVTKLRGGASALLDEIDVPAASTQVLIHTRDHTKGHPDIDANNHPIRHGAVVGVHNGVIANDDELFARYGLARHEEQMTVDSEAIFALMELHPNEPRVLRQLHGTMAAAWLDERSEKLHLARGISRPLWIGTTSTELYFASTRRALAIVEAALRVKLETRQVQEGRVLEVVAASVLRTRRFRPDRSYRETGSLSPVHSPHEAVSCLVQLAQLASA